MFLDTKGRTERDAEGKDCRIVEDTLHTKTKTAREPVELNTAKKTRFGPKRSTGKKTHHEPTSSPENRDGLEKNIITKLPGFTYPSFAKPTTWPHTWPSHRIGRYYWTLYLIALYLYGSGKSTCNYFDHPFKGAPSFFVERKIRKSDSSHFIPIHVASWPLAPLPTLLWPREKAIWKTGTTSQSSQSSQ